MARQLHRLNALSVKAETRKGMYADGGGLYLQVSSFDTKSWIYRFTRNRRTRDMGLGGFPDVSLSEAREEAQNCRKLVRKGLDPIEIRKSERQALQAETVKTMTFKQCADKYVAAHSKGWKNVKHARQWTSTLETYVYPVIGNLSVKDVDIGLVLKILEPIWSEKSETASRVRGRIESVLDWATARKYREGENPARWKGNLDKILPARSKVQQVKHHAALPYDEMGDFMAALRKQEGIAAMGLELLILTAARTGEIIKARWSEFDLDAAIWTIPAERMKAGKEHRVPLSAPALDVLARLREVSQNEFILPGQRPKSGLSNMAFLQLLKRMNRNDLTAHGFRSTFKDWATERTNYPNEVSEMALAHSVGNKVEAAYRRGDLYEKRVRIMRDWGRFCARHETVFEDKIVTIR
ncbi:integrase arm-type DNA-binding domain-containing protein [Sneathiella sp. CAU 1612]|uniref:Integrase arm-type DNA-binding domain-containing protein n=1 Tax=Sneathiella sedimenti TaxID=2816034 RepID=A0ABS3F986_9PROT|nr:integrase arm-type DNA-binding domain-containing protein [Sneathiella sedimenti]MBO0334944.1 integrase arm-type DNA-binding domain-containing protein [Sneathiella sedimenti]